MLPCSIGVGYFAAMALPLDAIDPRFGAGWSIGVYALCALWLADLHVHRQTRLSSVASIMFVLVGGAGCLLAADSLAPRLVNWEPIVSPWWQPLAARAASYWLAFAGVLALLIFPVAPDRRRVATRCESGQTEPYVPPPVIVVSSPALPAAPAWQAPKAPPSPVAAKICCSYCDRLFNRSLSRCPTCDGPA